jgi:hypothetical protein
MSDGQCHDYANGSEHPVCGGIGMCSYRSPRGARFAMGIGVALFTLSCAPLLGALQSAIARQSAEQSTPGIQTHVDSSAAPIGTAASGDDPIWWRLVGAHIDERPLPGADAIPNIFSRAVDLMIPAGWKLDGQVDWPLHKGNPSLAFHVDSPDGQIGLEYLPQESWYWSEDPATRASLQATGKRVQPLPSTRAADYLQTVLLPKLRSGAQVIAIEPLPTITDYLNREFSETNPVDKFDAEKNGVTVPKSSGDAARARITYLRNGAPVEEWIEIAVEHLQRHADNTPPWKPGETSREDVAPSGPMIDVFTVIECDVLRAPQGTLERNSRILGAILGKLTQNDSWTQHVSYEYWHGKFNDQLVYFRSSYFGDDRFYLTILPVVDTTHLRTTTPGKVTTAMSSLLPTPPLSIPMEE